MFITSLITLLFLGSGASLMLDGIDQTTESIQAEIVDESARGSALNIVNRMKNTSKDYMTADIDDETELLRLMQRYGTTTAELQAKLDASFEQRIQYQQEMLALRFELKDTLSREQWKKVFPKD